MSAILATLPHVLPSALIDRASLAEAMETVILAAEKRNTYPTLSNVRLTGDGNTLFVTTTNLDMEIVVAIPAAADRDLDLTVPAHTLRDLLKKAPASDMVSVRQPGTNAKGEFDDFADVEFDTVVYQIAALAASNFPDFKGPSHNAAYRFTVPGETILAALDAVSFAISNEETRYYLNGVFIGDRGDGLTFVATDGHRLAKQVLAMPDGGNGMGDAILPKGLVSAVQKLWKGKKCPDTVSVEIDDKAVRFQFGDATVTGKLIDGTFPDFDRVVPKSNDKLITLSISALQDALKAVSVIASERGGKAAKFEFSGNNLTLTVNNPDQGRAVTSIDADIDFEGEFEIGFNIRYVNELLANLKGEADELIVEFNDAGSPAVFKSSRDGWTGVLMPMRA